MTTPNFTIAAVERDTGLSKDVLRMWERRYGFPVPERDSHGERRYSAAQVERLRLIKRLMDQGHRPGKLIAADADELAALAPRNKVRTADGASGAAIEELEQILGLLQRHDVGGYLQVMGQRLARESLQHFVMDTIAPLSNLVGLGWQQGRLQVFEEHLFTELTTRLLRQTIASLPSPRQRPRVVLTSLPNEQHGLGLLMVEALLALEGAECIPLGTQTPLLDIERAARAHRADIVALSFSSAFTSRQIPELLQQLRTLLADDIMLWAGGSPVSRLSPQAGIELLDSLDGAVAALGRWRDHHY